MAATTDPGEWPAATPAPALAALRAADAAAACAICAGWYDAPLSLACGHACACV